jgi:hypothetical protein
LSGIAMAHKREIPRPAGESDGGDRSRARAAHVVRRPGDAGIGHNDPVAEGKHSGARKAPRQAATLQPKVFLLALAVTAAVVAWGYLVYLAIDFGTSARGGESRAWWFLALSSLGAVLCLFLALVLVARLLRAVGLSRPPPGDGEPARPRVPGGRRASR